MDSTNKYSLYTYGNLDEMDTYFKLNVKQQSRWDKMRQQNTFLRNEHHNIHQLIWKPGSLQRPILDDDDSVQVHLDKSPGKRPDSCHLHGTLTVNKGIYLLF